MNVYEQLKLCMLRLRRIQDLYCKLTSVQEVRHYADDLGLVSRHQYIQQKTVLLEECRSTMTNAIGVKVNTKKTTGNESTAPALIQSCWTVHILGKQWHHSRRPWHWSQHQDMQSKPSFCKTYSRLEIYRTQCHDQDQGLHHQRHTCFYLWIRVLKDAFNIWKEVLQTPSFRRTFNIFLPNTISKEKLCNRTAVPIIAQTILTRRMPSDPLPRVALRWTLHGKRNRGRPKKTWSRSVILVVYKGHEEPRSQHENSTVNSSRQNQMENLCNYLKHQAGGGEVWVSKLSW